MELLQSQPYVDLSWDSESRSVVLQWKGGAEGMEIRSGLEAGLAELIRRRPQAQWIGDTKRIGVIPDGEKAWIDQDWNPRFLATGVEFMAVVMPASEVARLCVKDIVSKVEGTRLTICRCPTLEEARTWMQSQRF